MGVVIVLFVNSKDVTDLFGADLPVEGGEAGQFVWRDGPLLKALKAGHWIVLDEVILLLINIVKPWPNGLASFFVKYASPKKKGISGLQIEVTGNKVLLANRFL